MPPEIPMLAIFAIRVAGGLAAMLLIAPRAVVPLAFFRTHCLVMLGLLVVAAVAEGRSVPTIILSATIAAAALAYLGSALWGIGLPRVALPITFAIALIGAGLIAWDSRSGSALRVGLNLAGGLASSALLGSTLTAMLLGHHYLTAPAMAISPLRTFVAIMAGSLGVRTLLAAAGLAVWFGGWAGLGSRAELSPMFLGMRWGMGVLGPALATVLAWKTVEIRSTQSATGILYIGMTLTLFGELSALILERGSGIVC